MLHLSVRRLALAVLLTLAPALASAQARITGVIRTSTGIPIADARIAVRGGTAVTTSQRDGRYILQVVPSGMQTLEVRAFGQKPSNVALQVPASGEVKQDVVLEASVVELTGLVVSATRQVEKITDAPATISRIEAEEIENSVGNSFAGALKKVKGIDFIQVGVTGAAINARGFNSSFNNRMLQMEDGRISVIGEAGLPLGSLTALSKVDLAGIEVVVGPGSALYGADASNGVVTIQTKDPKQYQGTTLEIAGGNRGYQNVQGRFARVTKDGGWGYKATAEYQKADDFENVLYYGTAPNTRPDTMADFRSTVARGTGSVVRYIGASRIELTGGYSTTDGIGPTNNGRNQLIGYSHNFQQLKFASPRWYATAYRTATNTGDTYQLNSYATNRPILPATISDDSVRSLASFPGGSNLLYGEVQYNQTLPALLNTRIIVGSQIRRDDVTSERRWLEDKKTGKDVIINQLGGYMQTETPITSQFRLVLAGRYDKQSDYDAQFSPKAALLFSPTPNHTFRASVNRAYKNPTILAGYFYATDFTILGATLGLGVFGNREGITFKNTSGAVVSTVPGLVPESNTTYELGWKGVLADRLFLDVTGYQGTYQNFFSPLVALHAFPTGTTATYGFGADGEEFLGPTGRQQWAFGYKNLGEAQIRGADIGLRWLPTNKVVVNGTLSLISLRSVDTTGTGTAGREAVSINSSPTKISVGVDFIEPVKNLLVGITGRSSDKYFFRSGVNIGEVPKFQTADLFLGYKLPSMGAQLNVNVVNAFACSGGSYSLGAGQVLPGTLVKERQCGFGQKHLEMVNMPELGTIVFVGVRFNR